MIQTAAPAEFELVDDLLQAYFEAVRDYNRALGAFDLTSADLKEAARREALNYACVKALKARLAVCGVRV